MSMPIKGVCECGRKRVLRECLHRGKIEHRYICLPCDSRARRERKHIRGINQPYQTRKDSSLYLGIHVAERALSRYFEDVVRMPNNNPGFDFICKNGFKIDVKSSCLHVRKKYETMYWHFTIKKNKIPDYFLLLVFNDRENLEPRHIWVVPGNKINHLTNLTITNSDKTLNKWAAYEKPLDKVISCCDKLKGVA